MTQVLVAALVVLTLAEVPALAARSHGQGDSPLAAEMLGTEVRTNDPAEMRDAILRALLDRYAADRKIEVTSEDVHAYGAAMDRMAAEDRAEREARRAELARRLESGDLSEAERKSLSSKLATLDELTASLDEMAENAAKNPEEARQARTTVAAAFIRQWKINQALYRQYGGRIIFQQGGPEPLDAYRRFLEEQQKQGAFRVVNKAFEEPFCWYYITDSLHSFYAPGSKEEAQAFEIPWWLLPPADGGERAQPTTADSSERADEPVREPLWQARLHDPGGLRGAARRHGVS